jgi:AraC-like DNA-binding protein/mannose-6-phosphate isomerase-like protein (cupin superfamily)
MRRLKMTFKEMEYMLFALTSAETEALQVSHLLEKYSALLLRKQNAGYTSTEEDEDLCASIKSSCAFRQLDVDGSGYITDDQEFGIQEGTLHVCQLRRYSAEPAHRHHFIEILIVYAGKCTQIIDGRVETLESGDVCVISLGTKHQILPLSASDIVVCLRIKTETLSTLIGADINPLLSQFLIPQLNGKKTAPYLTIPMSGNERFWSTLRITICEYYDHDYVSYHCFALYFTVLLLQIARGKWHDMEEPNHIEARGFYDAIIDYIQHFCRTCTLESIAKQFGFSTAYVSTLIKKRAGRNFSDLRRQYRLEHAAHLLKSSSETIENVAEQSGYANISFFYRAFKQHYGCTPSEYRNQKDK